MSCSVCSSLIKKNHRKLKCVLCNKYVHKSCSSLTAKEFRNRGLTSYWHCSMCNDNIHLPFNQVTDDRVFRLYLYKNFELDSSIVKDNDHFENLKFNPTVDENSFEEIDCNNNTKHF